MKKFFSFLLLIVVVVFGYIYWDTIKGYTTDVREQFPVVDVVLNNVSERIEDDIAVIEQTVYAPEPLKRYLPVNPAAFLTVGGTITETNRHRAQFGLAAVTENAFLNEAARKKVQDMFARQYFEHLSPRGVGTGELITSTGYEFILVGENLALGNYLNDDELVQAWMDSPGHRANILNEHFTEIGVAAMKGSFEGQSTWLAVQEFGKPRSDCPIVDNTLKHRIDRDTIAVKQLSNTTGRKQQELESSRPAEPATQEDVSEYNALVAEYNTMVKQHNDEVANLKRLSEQYNRQVKAFNNCIKE